MSKKLTSDLNKEELKFFDEYFDSAGMPIFQNKNYPSATRQFTRFGLFDREEEYIGMEDNSGESNN